MGQPRRRRLAYRLQNSRKAEANGPKVQLLDREGKPKLRFCWLLEKLLREDNGGRIVESDGGRTGDCLQQIGRVPLPPYIRERQYGRQLTSVDYQTVYAREPGAVAAPTAGLHFTEKLLARA